jgi:hypothetical protein
MRTLPASVVALGSLLVLVAAAGRASANEAGVFGRSGRTVGFTCAAAGCHGVPPGDATASFSITPRNADFPPISLGFVPGAAYAVTVTVSGGPAARGGFGWDSNGGTSRALDDRTRVNGDFRWPADVTHTAAGAALLTWTFEWTAPSERRAVGFWYSAVSADGDRARTNDSSTSPGSTQAPPLPVEILARIGNVNAAAGDPVPVLFVNGSRGDDARVIALPTAAAALDVSIGAYPGARPAIPYALYAIRRENVAADATAIAGVGTTAFTFPPSGGTCIVVANTIGRAAVLGAPRLPGTPLGPGVVASAPFVPARLAGASLTLQGLVPDKTAPSRAAVTNAIVIQFS